MPSTIYQPTISIVFNINSKITMNKRVYKIVGQKFLKDTQQYRNIPKGKRDLELRSILKAKSLPKTSTDISDTFPIQYQWINSNKKLKAFAWEPSLSPTALIVNYHCFDGHSGLSAPLAKKLVNMGCVFTSFDYPDFGKSEGSSTPTIDSMNQLLASCTQFLVYSKNRYPRLPTFLVGHDLGGLVALRVGISQAINLKGCIFLNPSLEKISIENKLFKRIGMFSNRIFSKLTGMRQLSQYSRPSKLKAKIFNSIEDNILECMENSRSIFGNFRLPYLYIQGGTDQVMNPFTAFDFEEQSRSANKEVVIIHEMQHRIWQDPHLTQVMNMSSEWVKQKI